MKKKSIIASIGAVILVIVIIIGVSIWNKNQKETIVSTSTITKILNISELSTIKFTYNGVAQVYGEEEVSELKYSVLYHAYVNAGIDLSKVQVSVDKKNKVINITIPEAQINDVNVDIGSLDYIFANTKYNTETISSEAYHACIEDVRKESAEEASLYQTAKDNAKSAIEALINPWIEQVDHKYQVKIS